MTNIINIKNTENSNKEMFNQVMASAIKVGNKYFATVPLRLLFVDYAYQRQTKATKVNALIKKWNIDKMDALRVSPRKETCTFAIIDGSHRFNAALAKEEPNIVCEILMNLSDNSDEREKQEARLYATQSDEVNKLAPVEKHNANVLLGIKENVILQKLTEKYNITIKNWVYGKKGEENVLTGFNQTLKIIRTNGKEHAEQVIRTLCKCRWNMAKGGLSSEILKAISDIYCLHPQYREDIENHLTNDLLINIEPEQFLGFAMSRYPMRQRGERNLLWLEDEVCKAINISRVYEGGKVNFTKTA